MGWDPRAATSLTRLMYRGGRPEVAVTCLKPFYDRFHEGFSTADLIVAKQLLDELGDVGA